mmetsp:Transcript_3721/g.12792  ORF Transcript_3721/g.12792 Transcript_3721/m.12792 type:complete len:485 (-) Transcript_3721:3-1457(-)
MFARTGSTAMAAVAAVTWVCTTCSASLVTRTTVARSHIPMHFLPAHDHPGGRFSWTARMTDPAPARRHALPVQTSTLDRNAHDGPARGIAGGGGVALDGGAAAADVVGGRNEDASNSSPLSSMKVIEHDGDAAMHASSSSSHGHASSTSSSFVRAATAVAAASIASHAAFPDFLPPVFFFFSASAAPVRRDASSSADDAASDDDASRPPLGHDGPAASAVAAAIIAANADAPDRGGGSGGGDDDGEWSGDAPVRQYALAPHEPAGPGTSVPGWAGAAFDRDGDGGVLAVARHFDKAVDVYENGKRARTLRTTLCPRAVSFARDPNRRGGIRTGSSADGPPLLAVAEGNHVSLWDVRAREKGGLVKRTSISNRGDDATFVLDCGLAGGDDGGGGVDEEDFEEEQGLVARLVHVLRSDSHETQYELLVAARKQFQSGGAKRLRRTLPPLAFEATRLGRAILRDAAADASAAPPAAAAGTSSAAAAS